MSYTAHLYGVMWTYDGTLHVSEPLDVIHLARRPPLWDLMHDTPVCHRPQEEDWQAYYLIEQTTFQHLIYYAKPLWSMDHEARDYDADETPMEEWAEAVHTMITNVTARIRRSSA